MGGYDRWEQRLAQLHSRTVWRRDATPSEDTDTQQQLSTALTKLDERSRDIIQQRWLTDDKATLHQLADKYQVSAERIRQLENNAIKKLKLAMT